MELRHDMLTHGVYVVAAQHQGRRRGLAVAWATQIATRELILASKAFGLSVLTREQLGVARAFGTQSSRKVNKFEGLGYHTAKTGSPLLDDCAVTFDCRIEAVYDQDGQKLIVGHIVAAERLREEYEPLIYREEDY